MVSSAACCVGTVQISLLVLLLLVENPLEPGSVSWNILDGLFPCVKLAKHRKGWDGTGLNDGDGCETYV